MPAQKTEVVCTLTVNDNIMYLSPSDSFSFQSFVYNTVQIPISDVADHCSSSNFSVYTCLEGLF